MNNKFSDWKRWADRTRLDNLSYPGVYAIAISELQQFDNTIKDGEGHGGARRVRFKYRDYPKLTKKLYVSVCPQKCDVTSNASSDLRLMGEVAKYEYECLALFVEEIGRLEEFGRLPEFNDKQRSPKL